MGRDDHRGVLGDVPSGLVSPLLHNETPEPSKVNVLIALKGFLHVLHEGFEHRSYGDFFNTGVLRYLCDEIRFRHDPWVWLNVRFQKELLRGQIYTCGHQGCQNLDESCSYGDQYSKMLPQWNLARN